MSPLKPQFPLRPAFRPDRKSTFHRRPPHGAHKATRETNSALETRSGLGAAREAEDHEAQGPRSCETEPAPKGRYGSSSVGSSAFRAVGYPTRHRIQRSSTACRKRAEHIQAVHLRQPLSTVIISAAKKICRGRSKGRTASPSAGRENAADDHRWAGIGR